MDTEGEFELIFYFLQEHTNAPSEDYYKVKCMMIMISSEDEKPGRMKMLVQLLSFHTSEWHTA